MRKARQQSSRSAFDTRLAVLLERTGALSYNSYAGKTTGELLFGASDNCAAIFPLRLRHALGNSSRRIGALGYNSYAGKTTGELLFGASDN